MEECDLQKKKCPLPVTADNGFASCYGSGDGKLGRPGKPQQLSAHTRYCLHTCTCVGLALTLQGFKRRPPFGTDAESNVGLSLQASKKPQDLMRTLDCDHGLGNRGDQIWVISENRGSCISDWQDGHSAGRILAAFCSTQQSPLVKVTCF
jgi:hypothetical protein